VPPDSDEIDKYKCNRHARNQTSDIIAIMFLWGSGVHSFMCTSAQFFAIMFLWGSGVHSFMCTSAQFSVHTVAVISGKSDI
jgi:hypothetical protein